MSARISPGCVSSPHSSLLSRLQRGEKGQGCSWRVTKAQSRARATYSSDVSVNAATAQAHSRSATSTRAYSPPRGQALTSMNATREGSRTASSSRRVALDVPSIAFIQLEPLTRGTTQHGAIRRGRQVGRQAGRRAGGRACGRVGGYAVGRALAGARCVERDWQWRRSARARRRGAVLGGGGLAQGGRELRTGGGRDEQHRKRRVHPQPPPPVPSGHSPDYGRRPERPSSRTEIARTQQNRDSTTRPVMILDYA
jgi:hypothetical protein